jgi:hypothetical protein
MSDEIISAGSSSDVKEQKPAVTLHGDLNDVVTAALVSVALYSGLVWFARVHEGGRLNGPLILGGILGAAIGWVAGILASPYNASEKGSFAELSKLIYGFLTGYVISKLDPIISNVLAVPKEGEFQSHAMVFAAFVLSSFMIAVALTYISRSYWYPAAATSTEGNLPSPTSSATLKEQGILPK